MDLGDFIGAPFKKLRIIELVKKAKCPINSNKRFQLIKIFSFQGKNIHSHLELTWLAKDISLLRYLQLGHSNAYFSYGVLRKNFGRV